ncbi:elongation factor P 5-aminopentanone reductase [Metabacillus niabensis]|uniref:3-oxoacyl-[acyl-carrier protein] reductase n=1 Tax=Metabacillus niabensis TaxID=324854 RepID=A0ABT9Z6V2_9BACI|nr:SDR family oxidoreductase [Metabacillus niabensis]MDQ0227542.1 3-oxoacyl-[acyl-carrier protein] reductase [Metabacillus niabensis]
MEKYALVTGASGGIGKAITLKLIEDGYHVYAHYHQNEQEVQYLIDSLSDAKQMIIPIQADLANSTSVDHLVQSMKMPIELLVINSGISFYGLMTDMSEEEMNQMIAIHLTSPFKLTQKIIPSMIRKKSGNIIVISSIWGITGASCEVLYSMVKGGQNSFVKALAKELAPSQIRVNAIAPGAIETKMLSNFTSEELNELKEEIPLGRLGHPDEVADAVSFLASKQSSYITGQVLSVNGGWV